MHERLLYRWAKKLKEFGVGRLRCDGTTLYCKGKRLYVRCVRQGRKVGWLLCADNLYWFFRGIWGSALDKRVLTYLVGVATITKIKQGKLEDFLVESTDRGLRITLFRGALSSWAFLFPYVTMGSDPKHYMVKFNFSLETSSRRFEVDLRYEDLARKGEGSRLISEIIRKAEISEFI